MRFLVETRLAGAPTPEMLALIPAETARGEELDAQGVRLHFFVAADMSGGWQVFEVDSRADLDRALESLPLNAYVTHKVTELGPPQP
jgi:muconolactone delta-isomerase